MKKKYEMTRHNPTGPHKKTLLTLRELDLNRVSTSRNIGRRFWGKFYDNKDWT